MFIALKKDWGIKNCGSFATFQEAETALKKAGCSYTATQLGDNSIVIGRETHPEDQAEYIGDGTWS